LAQILRLRALALYGVQTTAGSAGNRMLAAMACASSPPGQITHVGHDPAAIAAFLRPRPSPPCMGSGQLPPEPCPGTVCTPSAPSPTLRYHPATPPWRRRRPRRPRSRSRSRPPPCHPALPRSAAAVGRARYSAQ
jgi:hypothetical protein